MSYVAAADFRERTSKSYCSNILLTENDGTDAYLDACIAAVTTQVELDLSDDFEPPVGDGDETLEVNGSGRTRLYTPRRVRAITSVKTRDADGVLTVEAATAYRLHKSLDSANTSMQDGRRLDWLDVVDGRALTSGDVWPEGEQTVQIIGKFGWAAVPFDIKRLVALRVYGLVKATADPLTTITQRTTIDSVMTFGPSVEEQEIVARYNRNLPVYVG